MMKKHEWIIAGDEAIIDHATVANEGNIEGRGMAIVSVVYSMAGDILISCLLFLLPVNVFDFFGRYNYDDWIDEFDVYDSEFFK